MDKFYLFFLFSYDHIERFNYFDFRKSQGLDGETGQRNSPKMYTNYEIVYLLHSYFYSKLKW